MLVLSRKVQDEIFVGDNVKITILKVNRNSIRIGIEAPADVNIVRGELRQKESRDQADRFKSSGDSVPEAVGTVWEGVIPAPKNRPDDAARLSQNRISGQATTDSLSALLASRFRPVESRHDASSK